MSHINVICPFCGCSVPVKGRLPLAVLLDPRNVLDWGRSRLAESGHLGEHVGEMIVAARRG